MSAPITAPTGNAAVQAGSPWLSVLIPTHEGERWLAATLDSLVAQTRHGFECILIDSSEGEGTLAVADAYRSRLSIRIERRRDLLDWQGKTNHAAELARADHLCMLHQDDLWEPTRAERVASWLANAPRCALHLHPSWIVDTRGRRLGLWRCPLPSGRVVPSDRLLERLLVQNFVAICAPVIRRDAFRESGGLDRSLWYTADWDLYLKISRRGEVRYHAEPLGAYRIHGGALTVAGSRDFASFIEQMRIVLERHIGAVREPRRRVVRQRGEAAIAVNVALARALHGGSGDLRAAAIRVLRLGPRGIYAFLRDTRLIERVLPRLRSLLAGRFGAR